MSNPLDIFANELDALVSRYSKEADFSYAEIIGALAMKSHTLMTEAASRTDEIFPDIMDDIEE